MVSIQRSVLVEFSAEQMFNLVASVQEYPQYLPWCGGTKVHTQNAEGMDASILISYAGIHKEFRTFNRYISPHSIELQLLEGPFSELYGSWEFKSLGPNACKVTLNLHYAFASRTLEKIIGPVFGRITNSLVDSFIKEAQKRYDGLSANGTTLN